MKRRIVAILIAAVAVMFIAGMLSAGTACAHDPRFACSPRGSDHPVVIPDPTKSWAYYGDLAPGEADRYVFTVVTAAKIPASILVDVRDAQANSARPVAAVTDGRGRSVATLDLHAPIQFDEPFSRVRYVGSPTTTLSLVPGNYAIEVTMRGGTKPQRYALAVGSEERFGLGEIPYVLGAMYRIHNRKF